MSNYWESDYAEVRGKLLTLNSNILKTGKRRKLKFSESVF